MDEYLKNLYMVLEMCNLTIDNRWKFDPAVVKSAERIKAKTEKEIELRRFMLDRRSSLGKTQNNGAGCESSTANGF